MRNYAGLCCVLFVCLSCSVSVASEKAQVVGKQIDMKPTGAHATIDTKLATAAMRALQGEKGEAEKAALDIKAYPERYAPSVFYALAKFFFDRDEKDEALFWFYAGQLRGRYDANRCADISARSAINVLNERYGSPINKYAFQDIPKLKTIIAKVVEWDEKTGYAYDHRWINLHGMGAFVGNEPALSLPSDTWPAIAKDTRENYYREFQKLMTLIERKGL